MWTLYFLQCRTEILVIYVLRLAKIFLCLSYSINILYFYNGFTRHTTIMRMFTLHDVIYVLLALGSSPFKIQLYSPSQAIQTY